EPLLERESAGARRRLRGRSRVREPSLRPRPVRLRHVPGRRGDPARGRGHGPRPGRRGPGRARRLRRRERRPPSHRPAPGGPGRGAVDARVPRRRRAGSGRRRPRERPRHRHPDRGRRGGGGAHGGAGASGAGGSDHGDEVVDRAPAGRRGRRGGDPRDPDAGQRARPAHAQPGRCGLRPRRGNRPGTARRCRVGAVDVVRLRGPQRHRPVHARDDTRGGTMTDSHEAPAAEAAQAPAAAREARHAQLAQTYLPDDLLERFRARAAHYDRENAVPHEDLEELTASGYLRLFVPPSLGGPGLTLHEVSRLQQRLATAAPGTALAVNMHLMCTGVAHAMAARGDHSLDWVLEEAQAGEVFAFGISEPANDWVLQGANTQAEPQDDGGYLLSGVKIFTSLTPVWTRLIVHGLDASNEADPRLVYGFLDRSADGIKPSDDWDVMGMRAA